MKRIGLLSDTHGYLEPSLRRHFEVCDEIWHAGDIGNTEVLDELKSWKPVRAVYGNIDGHEIRSECPEELSFELEQVPVYITHIGGRPGSYARGVSQRLNELRPRLFICGHSHILLVKMDDKLQSLYMNPGAAGKHGFHQVRTAVRFYLDSGLIRGLEVIELGPRTVQSAYSKVFSNSNESK